MGSVLFNSLRVILLWVRGHSGSICFPTHIRATLLQTVRPVGAWVTATVQALVQANPDTDSLTEWKGQRRKERVPGLGLTLHLSPRLLSACSVPGSVRVSPEGRKRELLPRADTGALRGGLGQGWRHLLWKPRKASHTDVITAGLAAAKAKSTDIWLFTKQVC